MITIDPQLIKIIRSESLLAEKQGKLTSSQLEIIYQNRWFHLLVPEVLGGSELRLPDFARLMEKLATVDGSFAWVLNLGAGANMFAGFMDISIASGIFESEKTCIAGSGAISGIAVKKENGYVINGHWKYASGSAHATHFSLNAAIGAGNNEFRSFLVPATAVSVMDTWKVTGLKATASHDFKVENIWTPDHFLFNLQKPSEYATGTLYRFPFMLLAEINMVVMVTGLTIRFLELVKAIAAEKFINVEGKVNLALLVETIAFKKTISNVEDLFQGNRQQLFDCIDQCWLMVDSGQTIDEKLHRELNQFVSVTAESARNLVDALYPFLGMNVVFSENEINRVWRDFKVASQHALVSPMRYQ